MIIGLGGSIVTDCGLGMAQALGFVFLDRAGKEVAAAANPGLNALNLEQVASVRTDGLRRDFSDIEIIVASDVDIPLLGPRGQARTFGPQKYASAVEIEYLERGLANVAMLIRRSFGRDVDVPMAGAAGGVAAGLMGFLGARAQLGAELVASLIGLEARAAASDLVIIGEGRLDETTLNNKSPCFTGKLARRCGKPVIAIVGSVGSVGSPGQDGRIAPGAAPRDGDFYDRLIRAGDFLVPGEPLDAARIGDSLARAGCLAAGMLPSLCRAAQA